MIALGLLLIVIACIGVVVDAFLDFDMPVINLIAVAGIGGCLLFILGILAHG